MILTGHSRLKTVKIDGNDSKGLYAIVLNSEVPKEKIEKQLETHCSDLFSVEFSEPIVVAKGLSDTKKIFQLRGVKRVIYSPNQYVLASKEFREEKTVINVDGTSIGENPVIIAGPCSVESEGQLLETAREVKREGASILRGGAFKPRTSPYSFQGLGEAGLKILAEAREETGLPFVTEVMDTRDVPLVEKYSDMLQIGARNMQNFSLLKEVGKQSKPVLLKRSMNANINDLLFAAEYIMSAGNPNVVLCERGIRTFETATRNTLDISAVPVLNELTHLPVIIDPSHATGKRSAVTPMAKAAIAAGADGVMVEVHNSPSDALSDGKQSLTPQLFAEMMSHLSRMVELSCAH
ncbi:MAG: 3-deoxy-7-phosphoheptulonate synthase [Euryarchaeota archaeon]|nr:3-deoxy-7-phosphoheptulonate synthase [Euryarchaeota archaeon]